MTNLKKWMRVTAIRAAKTAAQTAIATIGTSAVLDDVNWLAALSASLLAMLISFLTSITVIPENSDK